MGIAKPFCRLLKIKRHSMNSLMSEGKKKICELLEYVLSVRPALKKFTTFTSPFLYVFNFFYAEQRGTSLRNVRRPIVNMFESCITTHSLIRSRLEKTLLSVAMPPCACVYRNLPSPT